MLDANLPSFVLQKSTDNPKQKSAFYFTQHGSDLEPIYSLRHPDPDLPGSKNRYAVAFYDAHNPGVLYGEVLLIPDWTQPTLSAEAIRLNGGVAPPPEPILPGEFVVQLYNPDQQVKVKQKAGSWNTTPSWEFEIPQQTFRQPSTSAIDRASNDPVASELTPKIQFKWKKDGKFGKDLGCYLSGRSVNVDGSRKRSKEPDITVAIFQALREVTLYEPNLNRVEIEDMKGFEVILLLSAVVIRDVFFGVLEQVFNISQSEALRKASASPRPPAAVLGLYGARPNSPSRPVKKISLPTTSANGTPPQKPARIPPTDPRSQWELDAETARLKKQSEADERERKRQEAIAAKKTKKMLDAEEKERKKQQAEVERETERLKKVHGNQGQLFQSLPVRPPPHQRQSMHLQTPNPYIRPQSVPHQPPQMRWGPPPQPRPGPGPGPALFFGPGPGFGHAPIFGPRPGFMPGPAPGPNAQLRPPGRPFTSAGPFGPPGAAQQPTLREKKSFFGFRRGSDTQIARKKSSVW